MLPLGSGDVRATSGAGPEDRRPARAAKSRLGAGLTPASSTARPAGGASKEPDAAGAAPGGWMATVSDRIRRAEYEFASAGEGAWAAPNRAQDLRVRAAAGAVEVFSRTRGAEAKDGGWSLGLSLRAFGREGALAPVAVARAAADGHRLEYRRGGLSEWYVNDERGLEQGFSVEAQPAGPREDCPLIVEMALSGSLRGIPAEDGKSIAFVTPEGATALRYAELQVKDAAGEKLDAELRVRPGTLQIRIHDGGAAFPLAIDPLLTSPVWTVQGFQPFDSLGYPVSTAGDVNGDGFSDVLVGAPYFFGATGGANAGRAALYLGSASGPSTSPAWTADGTHQGDDFGWSVATAGDVNGDGYDDVIIGSLFHFNGTVFDGAAFVYLGSASGLAATPIWSAGSGQDGSNFGAWVGTAGDVNGDGYDDIIVGAPLYANGQSNEGRVYVYLGSASGPGLTPAWTAESDQVDGGMGGMVGTAGDVNGDGYADVIVGASGFTHPEFHEGGAFVWLGGPAGLGPNGTPANADWMAETNQANGLMVEVATAGDVNGDGYSDVIVGAAAYDDPEPEEGTALVWLGGPAGLGPNGTPANAAWRIEGDQGGVFLGRFVSAAGDVNGDGFSDVIVGVPDYANGEVGEGRAMVFQGSPSGLSTTPAWTAEGNQADVNFSSVSAAGDVNGDGYGDVIVGTAIFNGDVPIGFASVYLGTAAGPVAEPQWGVQGSQDNGLLGFSVASAGDVNGDGYSDVLVGAPGYDAGQVDSGSAFLYLGSAAGPPTSPAVTFAGDQGGAALGTAVSTAGDVNGDGYSDILVGAPFYDHGQTDEGRAYVYLGSAGAISTTPAWMIEGDQDSAQLGRAVSPAGDVNGDGYGDVIVGTPYFTNGQPSEGRAAVYLGSAAGLSTTPAWTTEGNQDGANYGLSVAAAGDLNGDGYSDVLVGAPYFTDDLPYEGGAFAYLGSPIGLAAVPAWTAEGDQINDLFGAAVAGAGDVNGDGYGDVLVGAPDYSNGQTSEGRAALFLGSSAGPSHVASWSVESDEIGARMGTAVSTAGDVNNDGYSDVVVGAPFADTAAVDGGTISVYLGSASGLATIPALTAGSDMPTSEAGFSVAAAGDVNGDGFGDIVASAPFIDDQSPSLTPNIGAAVVFYGNAADGLDRIPRQTRLNGTTPIAVLGRTDAPDSFHLKGLGRTALGRGKVRLQWEIRPVGTPFSGTGLGAGLLRDTGAPSAAGSAVALEETVGGLSPGGFYHWRLRTVAKNPLFPHTPWLSLPDNPRTETDLRTAGCHDLDGDGYGSPGDPVCPAGGAADCNDRSPAAHPGAVEICDGLDNDCDGAVDNPPVPAGVPGLTLSGGGAATILSWTALSGAVGYDVVRGDVATLRSSGGNFSTATTACSSNDLAGVSLVAPDLPAAGQATWYLVRGENCGGHGTYDSGAPSQVGSRDPGINASAQSCP